MEKIKIIGVDGYRGKADETKFPMVEIGRRIKEVAIDLITLPVKIEERMLRKRR